MKSENLKIALKLEEIGKFEEALEIYKLLIEVFPNDLKIKKSLWRAYNRAYFLDREKLALFLSDDKEDMKKFKDWLVEL